MKKILIIGLIILVAGIGSILTTQFENKESIVFQETNSQEISTVISMPTKSSRPSCDESDKCYIPSLVSIKKGESVKWLNEDAAFHSVTSGTYENPDGIFDSGYLDPNDSFTLTFEDSGVYDYFCTLHPWMKGQVVVE